MNVSKKQPIAQIGNRPPTRITRLSNGDVLEEQIPASPSRKIVTPAGTVTSVPIVTGRVLVDGPGNVYWGVKIAEKLTKGYLLYSECPYANGTLPTPAGVKPCKGTHPAKAGVFWNLNPRNPAYYVEPEACPHIEEIIARRQEKHAAHEAEFSQQFKSAPERYYELEERKAQEKLAAAEAAGK